MKDRLSLVHYLSYFDGIPVQTALGKPGLEMWVRHDSIQRL